MWQGQLYWDKAWLKKVSKIVHKMQRESLVDPENSRNLTIVTVGSYLFFVGIPGNFLVIIAIWKKRSLRSKTNFLLVNLAISDVISLLFSPFMLIPKYLHLPDGTLGDVLCKFIFSYNVSFTTSIVSILTLTVLSVERYHAVVKPMEMGMRLRNGTVKYAVIAVWLTGILLSLPLYINGHHKKSSQACRHILYWDRSALRLYQFLLVDVVVFIAFAIIGFCYFHIVREMYFKKINQQDLTNHSAAEKLRNQRKQRVVKLSLSVTLIFAVFLLPFAVLITMKYFDELRYRRYFQIAAIFFFSEAGINPFLYAFQSTIFRRAFKDILKCRCGD